MQSRRVWQIVLLITGVRDKRDSSLHFVTVGMTSWPVEGGYGSGKAAATPVIPTVTKWREESRLSRRTQVLKVRTTISVRRTELAGLFVNPDFLVDLVKTWFKIFQINFVILRLTGKTLCLGKIITLVIRKESFFPTNAVPPNPNDCTSEITAKVCCAWI